MKHLNTLLFIFLLSIFSFSNSQAQEAAQPKIGIAFGGGGAKGIAHIGVIEVLEENGIYPSYITGTSMGSIIAGLYAIGYTVDDLEKLAKELDWDSYFVDDVSRKLLSIEEKPDAERYQMDLSVDVEKRSVELPKGFIGGQKMAWLLAKLTSNVHHLDSFDDFKYPFRCIAVDLETGKDTAFHRGYLPDAIRASAAIPSIFEPVELGGKLFIDGGVKRNLPVQDAFDMGADIVIGIDVGGPLLKKEELFSLIDIISQTASYQVVESTNEQRELADVMIDPAIKKFGVFSFGDIDTLLQLGRIAARAQLPKLKALIQEKGGTVGQKVEQKSLKPPKSFNIHNISVEGREVHSEEMVNNLLGLEPQLLTIKEIEQGMKRLYGTKFFKNVNYEILPNESAAGTYNLRVMLVEESNTQFRLSAHYDNDYKAGILMNFTARNSLFLKGSKISLDARLAERPALLASYVIYTPWRPSIGLKISGMLNSFPAYIYDYSNNNFETERIFQHGQLRGELFTGITNNFSAGAGVSADIIRQNEQFFSFKADNLRMGQTSVFVNSQFDSYDRLLFPTTGIQLQLQAKLILGGRLNAVNVDNSSNTFGAVPVLTARYQQAMKVTDKLTVQWFGSAGYMGYKNSNYFDLFYLGRALPYESNYFQFIGLEYMEQAASRFAFGGLTLQMEPAKDKFIALTMNAGRYSLKGSDNLALANAFGAIPETSDKMLGVGIQLGAITPIAPLLMTAEYNAINSSFNFSFRLGHPF